MFDVNVVSEANMLYLESPAGVGFSYSTDPAFYEGVGDSMTGEFYICLTVHRSFLFFSVDFFFTCSCRPI